MEDIIENVLNILKRFQRGLSKVPIEKVVAAVIINEQHPLFQEFLTRNLFRHHYEADLDKKSIIFRLGCAYPNLIFSINSYFYVSETDIFMALRCISTSNNPSEITLLPNSVPTVEELFEVFNINFVV